jgi:putative oxidoreductase
MDALFLIGRFLFGLLFVVSGLAGHLGGYRQLTAYAAAKNIPLPGPAVLVSGVGIVLGGIGIIAGIWPDLSALVIAMFLFCTSFFIHNFWTVKGDAMMRLTEMTQFQKDLALLGAALVLFAVTAFGGEFGPTVTDPLFEL